jgi:hypothetical protein
MSARRQSVVKAAWAKLDTYQLGSIRKDDIKKKYNAKSKPSVTQGKQSEDDALYEFLDDFDTHVLLMKGNMNER